MTKIYALAYVNGYELCYNRVAIELTREGNQLYIRISEADLDKESTGGSYLHENLVNLLAPGHPITLEIIMPDHDNKAWEFQATLYDKHWSFSVKGGELRAVTFTTTLTGDI